MIPASVERLSPGARALLSRRPLWWILAGLLAVACIYRLATFTPQPLDSPDTLRPVLNDWFSTFLRFHDTPENAYQDWRGISLLALLLPPALAIVNLLRDRTILRLPVRVASMVCSRAVFFLAIGGVLLLCRFPTLVDYQLNPDEGQFLTAAHKLFYDGSFFHAVDCGTSGPLNVYPLMLPALLGLSPDYASSRLLALMGAFFSIYFLYRSARLLSSESIARIAILPAAVGLAVFEHTNLVHYSSEQIPVLLVSAALYLCTRVLVKPASNRVPLFVLGVLTSAAFFAKMQGLPIVAAIAMVALTYVYTTRNSGTPWRPAVLYGCGALSLQLLNVGMCLADGVLNNFWISYIVSNRRYADAGTNFIAELPTLVGVFMATPEIGYYMILFLALAILFMLERTGTPESREPARLMQLAGAAIVVMGLALSFLLHADVVAVSAYVILLVAVLAPVYGLLLCQKGSFGTDPVRWFGLLSAVATAVAIYCIYRPHRPFPHYLYFAFVPISTVMAWLLIRQQQPETEGDRSALPRGLAFPLLFAVLAATHGIYLWGSREGLHFRTTVATIRPPEGDLIRSLTSSEGQIFVWGWTADPYLSSARVSPAREYNMFYFFGGRPDLASYYRKRLLQDLSQNPPELFIDAISPVSWAYEDRARFNFEQFPEIASFVKKSYVHLVDAFGQRFYMRRDIASRATAASPPRSCAPDSVRCMPMPRRFFVEGATSLLTDDLPALPLPSHTLLEADFTPFGRQSENGTVFTNEAAPEMHRGFRFQNVGADQYRLLLGLGDRWAISDPILLPPGKRVALAVEVNDTEVEIRNAGVVVARMHLGSRIADSKGPIHIGSWLNGQNRLTGAVDFFQIVDRDKSRNPS
jgi:hypothetical protein